MKVSELVKLLERLNQNEEICISEPYDNGYVSLSKRNLKYIDKLNGYRGYLLDSTNQDRVGEVPLTDYISTQEFDGEPMQNQGASCYEKKDEKYYYEIDGRRIHCESEGE